MVSRMTDTMVHRGPDDRGVYVDESVSLGNRRLSVIDLSEHGRMPLSNEDGSVWVTYNGEIYNFGELREKLIAKGHRFRSRTDTEVIVHAYEEYGPGCVDHFNGMFAFAIWDKGKQELLLARDRFGIKPLYYYFKNGKLVFGSELKALLEVPEVDRDISPQSLYYYMGYEYVPTPGTIFQHVHKLAPGHYLRFRNRTIALTQYWDVQFPSEPPRSEDSYAERLQDLLGESVRRRLVSDVPLGVFLSGGLDSSSMVALMSRAAIGPIKTFSLGYEDPTFSELDYARQVSSAFHTDHTELMIEPVSPELVEEVIWHLDEPMSELSTIPFYLICKKAREHVTVCISGEGSDEVLVGYDRFRASKANEYYRLIPRLVRRGIIGPIVRALPDRPEKKGVINILKRFVEGGLLPEEAGHMRWQYFGSPRQDAGLFSPAMVAEITRDPFAPIREIAGHSNAASRLDREIYIEMKLPMPELALMKVDRMSMAHGLEVRVPFLDHEFVEFCMTVPGPLKLRGFTTKSVLRSAMRGILPDAIVNRGKQGFSIPIKNWLRNELRDYMQDVLTSSPLIRDAFNIDHIQGLIREHLAHRANHSHVLWALVNLGVWHRTFLEGRPGASFASASSAVEATTPIG